MTRVRKVRSLKRLLVKPKVPVASADHEDYKAQKRAGLTRKKRQASVYEKQLQSDTNTAVKAEGGRAPRLKTSPEEVARRSRELLDKKTSEPAEDGDE